MIRNSFIILDGVGKRLEENIWKQGITSWELFLDKRIVRGISKRRKELYDNEINRASKALYELNSSYFIEKLPLSETWRLYEFFKDEAIFLDIETSMDRNISIIGLFDGIETKIMIKNINLDYIALKNELMKYKLIVTFNGASFDLPILKRKFPNLLPRIPHFDVRFACRKINLNGGLKEVEKKLGIERCIEVKSYSFDAIQLWDMFKKTKNKYYLELLIKYNEEDVINLKSVSDRVVKLLKTEIENEFFKD